MKIYKLIKILPIISILFLLIGCASLEVAQVSKGNYAEAFRNFLYTNDNKPDHYKARDFSQLIKDKAGKNLNDEFLFKSLELFDIHGHSEYSVIQLMVYIDYAYKYELIDDNGKNRLNDVLYIAAGKVWATTKRDLTPSFYKTFPEIKKYLNLSLDELYESALKDSNLPYHTLTKIYNNELGKSNERAAEIIFLMKERIKTAREKRETDTPVSQFIEAYELTKDANIKKEIIEYLKTGVVSKSQMELIAHPEFSDFASTIISSMTAKISIESESNESLIDEISEKLQDASEWIEISENANRKIKISRVKFSDREVNSGWRAQVLSDLSLGTLLIIPANASVLVDVATSKYEVIWSLNIRDSINNKVKIISGRKNFYKNECANPRFRNVFGGEGALSYMPSEATICSNSNTNDFNKEREKIIGEIAAEMVDFININSRLKNEEK